MEWYEWVLTIVGGVLTFAFGGGLLFLGSKAVGAIMGIKLEIAELRGEFRGFIGSAETRMEHGEKEREELRDEIKDLRREIDEVRSHSA